MSELKTSIVDYALQNVGNLEVAFETYMAYNDICSQLSKDVLFKLKERLEKSLGAENWIYPDINSPERNGITFLIKSSKWTNETAFGIKDFSDVDRACFAVQTNEENKQSLFSKINEENPGKITGFGWWTRLDSPFNRWNESFEGLESIYNSNNFLDYAESHILNLSRIIDKYFYPEGS